MVCPLSYLSQSGTPERRHKMGEGPLRFNPHAFLWSDRHLQRRDIVPAAIDKVRERLPTPRALGP